MSNSALGNLGVEITARANQFIAELVKSEGAMSKFQRSLGRTMTKAGLDVVGLGNAARALSTELRFVFENIEKIPGINPASVASVVEMRQEVQAFKEAVHSLVADGIALFADFGKSIGMVAAALTEAFSRTSLSEMFLNPTVAAAKFATAIESIDEALRQEYATAAETAAQQNALALATNTAAAAVKAKTEADREGAIAADAVLKANAALLENERRVREGAEAEDQARANQLRAEGIALYEKYRTPVQAYADEMVRLNEILKANPHLQEEVNKAMADAHRQMEGQAKPVKAEAAKASEAVQDIGFAFEMAFERAMQSGANFKSILKGLADDILKTFLRLAIINPIMNGLFGGFAGYNKKPTLAGERASGGPVESGRPYLVGERGPEIMVPQTSGRIIPNSALTSGGAGGTYYIDARGADRTGLARLEAMIRDLNGSIEARAIGAVFDSRRRAASYA